MPRFYQPPETLHEARKEIEQLREERNMYQNKFVEYLRRWETDQECRQPLKEEIAKLRKKNADLQHDLELALKKLYCKHLNLIEHWVGEPETGGPDRLTFCKDCGQSVENL